MDIAISKKFEDLDFTIYGTFENPLVKANDIGNLLGIKNIRDSIKDFNENQKGVVSTDTLGGIQNVTMLTMKGVYKLLMNSRKPIAEKFQDWLADVIEEIRKTGQYRTDERIEFDKKLIKERTLLESYHKKPVNYLIDIGNSVYKFGYTSDIRDRLQSHKREIGEHITLEFLIECDQHIEMERKFKEHTEICSHRIRKEINNKIQTELIKLSDNFGITDIIKILSIIKNSLNDSTLEIARMKHDEFMAEQKTKQMEIELKMLETQLNISVQKVKSTANTLQIKQTEHEIIKEFLKLKTVYSPNETDVITIEDLSKVLNEHLSTQRKKSINRRQLAICIKQTPEYHYKQKLPAVKIPGIINRKLH